MGVAAVAQLTDEFGYLASEVGGVHHLAHDIWLKEAPGNPQTLIIGGREYARFLDVLYIPTATHLLLPEQVIAINRFREATFHHDQQFGYNRTLKSVFRVALRGTRGPVLEIGPGLFPLFGPIDRRYATVDIDRVAITHLQARGYDAHHVDGLGALSAGAVGAAFACFVFQFSVSDATLTQLANTLREDGILIYNVLTRDATTRTNVASRLSALGFSLRLLNVEGYLNKTDVLYFASRSSDGLRNPYLRAAQELQHLKDSFRQDRCR